MSSNDFETIHQKIWGPKKLGAPGHVPGLSPDTRGKIMLRDKPGVIFWMVIHGDLVATVGK